MQTIVQRFGRLFSEAPLRDRESAYLNDATSIVDLEMRMREIDRGKFRNRF